METILWERPRTTRRYLNPPKAERIYTLWAEGKIIFGEMIRGIDWRSYGKLTCSGMWFVYGNDNSAFDFRTVKNLVETDGTPIHGLEQILQCFCYPVGEDILMLRQGGLQRLIWPWEACFALEALGKIGDFSDYIEQLLQNIFTDSSLRQSKAIN